MLPKTHRQSTPGDGRMGGREDGGLGVLGLFPAFEAENPGGVQVSGRSAWSALQGALGARAQAVQVDITDTAPELTSSTEFVARSRRAALWQVWRRRHADTVLCWHFDLLPLTRLTRGKRVLFLHGIEAWRRREPFALPKVSLLLANSEYTLARTLECIPSWSEVPSRIVPLGIKAPVSLPVAPEDPPTAIMIGRMDRGERYKGHEEALAAWPRVQEQLPNARLWIVGDGSLRRELEARARKQAQASSIRFFGRVDESDKEKLLARSRCLVMPSRAEGFGLVYAEAMRLGRPCLVSTFDAGREIVHPPDGGLAVDPRDTAALSAALVALLSPGPQWERWSTNARSRYSTHFTETAFQQRLLAALSDSEPEAVRVPVPATRLPDTGHR
jgi:glycosyltransferase involved in cell wall biosynthesis